MNLFGRIVNDYFLPGRWKAYRAFLSAALEHQYEFVRHQDAMRALAAGKPRLFFLRHDVDTDLANTRTMFTIERELGIPSTYYFRRCTADAGLMRAILASGGEVGYHYEELSDFAKATGARTREAVMPRLDAIREVFLRNLKDFETRLGAKVVTVAGHGDFTNVRLDLRNTVLINDAVRAAAGIQLEAYDEDLASRLTLRTQDQPYPGHWRPASPIPAVQAGEPVILVLIHPRHWQRAPLHRARLDAQRLYEGLHYYLKRS